MRLPTPAGTTIEQQSSAVVMVQASALPRLFFACLFTTTAVLIYHNLKYHRNVWDQHDKRILITLPLAAAFTGVVYLAWTVVRRGAPAVRHVRKHLANPLSVVFIVLGGVTFVLLLLTTRRRLVTFSLPKFLGDFLTFTDEAELWNLNSASLAEACEMGFGVGAAGVWPNSTSALAAARLLGPQPVDDQEALRASLASERKHGSALSPFRVSPLVASEDALAQSDDVNDHLRGCRLSWVSSVTLGGQAGHGDDPCYAAIDKEGSQCEPLTLRANPHGTGAVAVVFQHKWSNNVYHMIHMDEALYCVYLATTQINWPGVAYAVPRTANWRHPVAAGVLESIVGGSDRVAPLIGNRTFLASQPFSRIVVVGGPVYNSPVLGQEYPMFASAPWAIWDDWKFERNRLPNHFGMSFASKVRQGLGAEPRAARGGNVVVLQRRGTRKLVGSLTGGFAEVIAALEREGLPVQPVEFEDGISVSEQAQIVAGAAVFIAVHGAGLVNVAWMRPGSVVCEIVIRKGKAEGDDYSAGGHANAARFFGQRWFYHDPVALLNDDGSVVERDDVPDRRLLRVQRRDYDGEPWAPEGNIRKLSRSAGHSAPRVVVDAQKLASFAKCAYKLAIGESILPN